MAYTLTEDCTYSLTKKEDEKKRVYFVKLTDSCLKALEDYVTNKVDTHHKPTIKFEGQNGAFQIPCRPGSAGKDVCKKFDFVVSKLISVETNPLQGILECVKHTKEEFISYGQLEEKLSVAASDDSYEQTRNRMAQVDQERKDVSTKEIKLVKKDKKLHKSKPVSSEMERKLAAMKKHNSQTVTPKPTTSSISNQLSPGTNKNSPSLKAVNCNKSSPSLSHKTVTSNLTKSSTINNSVSKSSSQNVVAPKNSSVNDITLSCRERVVHVLAIKALKKPELMTRLQKEAMSQKDRNNLPMVLKQVSTLQDNAFKLNHNLYSEVRVDSWPFYTDNERLAVKKNMLNQKVNSALSPQMVTSTSKSPEIKVNGLKRALDVSSTLDSKKSFCNEEPSSTSSSSPLHNNAKIRKTESSKENKKPSYEEESPPTVASTSETPEHLVNYKPIITYEQRCQYKSDFQAEYPEYIELKKNLDAITTKFIELDHSWRRQEKGSDEYYRLQDEIIDSYNKQQEDEKYKSMKKRCEELHLKLSHIKKLVVDYDNGHT